MHENALCETQNVGDGTRIWAFAHVLPGAQIGSECNICDHVFVENDVVIGDRVTVKCGVQLWDGVQVEDDVFIGPNASFSNDRFPRSKHYQEDATHTYIGKGASIGVNSTILPGVRIGRFAMIGGGTVITHDVPPFAVVAGNPGRIVGYADSKDPAEVSESPGAFTNTKPDFQRASVPGVTVHRFARFEDLRGSLAVAELESMVPFVPKRVFMVNEVPSEHVRGEHAHRTCEQFLVCVSGSLAVVVDDGANREEIALDGLGVGVYVPPMVWATQYKYTKDATLLVFASHSYDADDYIREYEDFLSERQGTR